uniref:family 78 glycoside hydrolase catalytic domain n=1 Tax=Aquiflexum sp. TaxID=1872584 RepID=UPI0035948BAE
MKNFLFFPLLLIHLISYAGAPKGLKVNYHTNPLGVDNPTPWFSWEVGDLQRGAVQSAYRLLVSSSIEKLDKQEGDIWDSKKVNGNQTIQIIYKGKSLKPMTRYFWKVQTWNGNDVASEYSPTAWFETGIFSKSDWKATWISDGKLPPSRDEAFYDKIPAPLFRKSFNVDKEVKNARLYVSGLGYYEAYLNGEKVGDHYLDPGWTQYGKEVYYAVYDVTHQVKKGQNAIGAMVGNGWYNPLPMKLFGRWNLREILTIGQPKILAQLEIEYSDGSKETIATDQSWKTSEGPVVKNNVYLGEWYDARLETDGWDKVGFNDNKWKNASNTPAPAGALRWQYIPPIRHTKSVYPIKINTSKPDTYVIDMGQNFAGVIRFKVSAPLGTEIRFRYAELIYDDGTLDFRTSAATQIKEGGINGGPGAPATAWQEDRYITKGEGVEVFEPKFTFHGFRYVEVTGLKTPPSLSDIEGIRLNADLPSNASFQCSNQLFNRVQEVTEWTMLSNVFSIQSDCPAREKFGYGGDIVTAGETYLYNYDM